MTQEVLYCFEDDDFGAVSSRDGRAESEAAARSLQAGHDNQSRVQDEIEQFHRGFVGRLLRQPTVGKHALRRAYPSLCPCR
jgi:hypothetical protein